MKVEKKKLVNDDSDLKFTPLNITNPLKPNNLNLSSLTPVKSLDGVSINSDYNNFYIGFPPFGLNFPSNNLNSPNANNNSTKTTEYYPLTPYPSNIPTLDLTNTTTQNDSIENNINDEYPSEVNADELYSYNSSNINNNYTKAINPIDILRNFDFSIYDLDSRESNSNTDIDTIFNYIQSNTPDIFSTLQAYRIPYPIATLLIKKIIKLTLEHK